MTYKDNVLERANPRWLSAVRRQPELAPAVELQRQVVARQLDLGKVLDASAPLTISLEPGRAVEHLSATVPVLLGEPVVIELEQLDLMRFVPGFCDDLAQGAAGGAAHRLAELLSQGAINVSSLVAASVTRQQEAIRTKANHLGISPDLLWLVAELAAGPVAHRAQRDLLSNHRDDRLDRALSTWPLGCCPACGSWPAFAEHAVASDEGLCRCSFCGCAWRPSRAGCVYCDDSPEPPMTAVLDDTERGRRLELCRRCAGYLKRLELDGPTPFELLAVEDLCSSDLDIGAAQKGYRRPAMRDFPSRVL